MGRNLEREVVNKVADYISSTSGDELKVLDKRLGLWRFKKLKEKLPTLHFLYPDIDILLSSKTATQHSVMLTGVEVKTIYLRKNNEPNTKFYEGLDEAIALLRFGIDGVRFFQVFLVPLLEERERDKMTSVFVSYQMPIRDIIRTLNLPINYTPAFDFLIENELSQWPIKVLDLEEPAEAPEDRQIIISNRANPFLNSHLEYPKVIRDFILSKYIKN